MIVYGNVFQHCVVMFEPGKPATVLAITATERAAYVILRAFQLDAPAFTFEVTTLDDFERNHCLAIEEGHHMAASAR